MIALVQRVREASVTVDDEVVGAIGPGMLILLGIHKSDTVKEADWLAAKCAALRIFADEDGRMNRALTDIHGEALVVSQFTLYGNTRKGNRPSYIDAAEPDIAEPLYRHFSVQMERHLGKPVPTGRFGAMMDVALVNDGPVTLWMERLADS